MHLSFYNERFPKLSRYISSVWVSNYVPDPAGSLELSSLYANSIHISWWNWIFAPLLNVRSHPLFLRKWWKKITDVAIYQRLTCIAHVWHDRHIADQSWAKGGIKWQGPPKERAPARSPGKPRGVVVCQFRWDPRSMPVRRGMGASANVRTWDRIRALYHI